MFDFIAVFVSRTVLYCIGRRRFFRCKVREIAMEKPLLQPEYEATLKRVDRSNIIVAVLSTALCILVVCYSFFARKSCNYVWCFIFSLSSLLTESVSHFIWKQSSRKGSQFVLAFLVNGIVLLVDAVFVVLSIISLWKTHYLPSLIILVCSILQQIFSLWTVRKLYGVAHSAISVYDETYSILACIRFIFFSERTRRLMKLFNCLALSLLFLLQFAIARYSHCSQMTSLVSLLNAATMLLSVSRSLLHSACSCCTSLSTAARRATWRCAGCWRSGRRWASRSTASR